MQSIDLYPKIANVVLFVVCGTLEHHIGRTLEQNFVKDPKAIFEVGLGANGFMYRVDFINMSQTNVSAGGHRQRRLHRGDPPLDLDRYIGWKALEEIHSIPHIDPNTGLISVPLGSNRKSNELAKNIKCTPRQNSALHWKTLQLSGNCGFLVTS